MLDRSEANAHDARLSLAPSTPLCRGAELFLWEKTPKNSLNKAWGTWKEAA